MTLLTDRTNPTDHRDAGGGGAAASVAALARSRWHLLILVALVGAGVAYGASFLITPAYRATVVLMPARDTDDESILSGLPGALGGLAGFAGISLGSNSNRTEALELLRSARMARTFIARERISESLADVAGRDESDQEILKFFRERVLDVVEDKRTNVIRLSVTWKDPTVAAAWANAFVALANSELQERAVNEAAQRRAFLERELRETNLLELKAAAYRLIESQMKAAMLAATRSEYSFQVIDPAVAPDADDRVRPKRALLASVGALLGAGICLLVLWLRRTRPGVG